jgi:hypothetical protein
MVDDGFLIGFEDSNGNFVEVGRFNNTADDVTQPLEIKHANSGERITLDSSGLKTQKIDEDRLYAGAFAGNDPDTRLSNAISNALAGSKIFLENTTYSSDITVNKELYISGVGCRNKGTSITGTTTWTFNEAVSLSDFVMDSQNVTVNINQNSSNVSNLSLVGGAKLNVDGIGTTLLGIKGGSIELLSNSQRCTVDGSSVSVIDNGSNNVVGDIA